MQNNRFEIERVPVIDESDNWYPLFDININHINHSSILCIHKYCRKTISVSF